MRGTCAVIGMVLLVVLVAHLQREEERRDDELAGSAMTYHAGACASPTADLEAELADAESADLGDAPAAAPAEPPTGD